MKSEAVAEQFLNEIKGIFGIHGVYFLVSVRTTLQHQDTASPTTLSVMAHRLVQEDVRRKSRAIAVAARRLDAEPLLSSFLAACGEVAQLTVDVDALGVLIESVVPDRTGPDDATTRRLRRLISELAGFYYYSATLLDFFDDHAPDSRWQEATIPQTPGRAIDKFTVARQAFSTSPFVAWQGVSRFREAWDMKTLEFPQGLVPEPAGAG